MYELKVKQSTHSDATADEFDFIVDDLISAIDLALPEGTKVIRKDSSIYIDTLVSENELKEKMKAAFTYHFNDLRYVSLKCS